MESIGECANVKGEELVVGTRPEEGRGVAATAPRSS